jgi:hypothetical protein
LAPLVSASRTNKIPFHFFTPFLQRYRLMHFICDGVYICINIQWSHPVYYID